MLTLQHLMSAASIFRSCSHVGFSGPIISFLSAGLSCGYPWMQYSGTPLTPTSGWVYNRFTLVCPLSGFPFIFSFLRCTFVRVVHTHTRAYAKQQKRAKKCPKFSTMRFGSSVVPLHLFLPSLATTRCLSVLFLSSLICPFRCNCWQNCSSNSRDQKQVDW